MKRFLAALLVAACALSVLPAAAFAETGGFNARLDVTQNEDGSVSVTVPAENAAVLAEKQPNRSRQPNRNRQQSPRRSRNSGRRSRPRRVPPRSLSPAGEKGRVQRSPPPRPYPSSPPTKTKERASTSDP